MADVDTKVDTHDDPESYERALERQRTRRTPRVVMRGRPIMTMLREALELTDDNE